MATVLSDYCYLYHYGEIFILLALHYIKPVFLFLIGLNVILTAGSSVMFIFLKTKIHAVQKEIMFYKAKSMSQEYNRELLEMIENVRAYQVLNTKARCVHFIEKGILELVFNKACEP